MGRNKDPRKSELISQLGLLDSTKKWTKEELEAKLIRTQEQEQQDAEAAARTQLIAGDVPAVPAAELPIPFELDNQVDPLTGLTERQKMIARLRMRNMSQQAIANIINVSQALVSKELTAIREWQAAKGRNVNQAEVVGNTTSLYEEVEYRAWELYHNTNEVGEKAKALAVVMQAREKHTKLLMDLGLIKKASTEITHKLEVSPFLEGWKSQDGKKSLGDALVAKQLPELAEPALDEIEDAEVIADVTAVAERVIEDDLAEPELDEDFVLDD